MSAQVSDGAFGFCQRLSVNAPAFDPFGSWKPHSANRLALGVLKGRVHLGHGEP